MLKKTLLMSSIIAALLSTGILAHPDEHNEGQENSRHYLDHGMRGEGGHGGQGMRRLHRAFAQLDLTEDQKASLKGLKENNKESMRVSHESLHSLKEEMRPLLDAEVIDEAAVKALSRQIAELKAEQMIKMASLKKQAIALLTDEQRDQLEQMKQKRQKHKKEHRSRG